MTRTPYFDKNGKKKGAWSKEEDNKLIAYIEKYGHWNWSEIPKFAGVSRCGKSCRLRWVNYLRPNMKRGNITKEEEDLIVKLHGEIGNKWSAIAAKLPGRSDNEIKNYWNTNLKKIAKQDQLHHTIPESCNSARTKHNLILENAVKDEIALTSSSTGSSSGNSLGHTSSSSFMQTFDIDKDGSFWMDPFLVEVDSTPTNGCSSSLDLAQASSCDMLMDDEFVWSTMNLYDGYHKQLQKCDML
ncbi:hypothetical protein R6Q57_029750 [Mikania cordata]